MASQVPPIRGAAYYFEVGLVDQAAPLTFRTNPTLAAGDVTVYKDGVLDGNIDTLPTAIGAGKVVGCTLSAAEMTADRVAVLFSDVAGAEWGDRLETFETSAQSMDDIADAIDLNTLIISPVGGTTDGIGAVDGTTVLDSTRAEPTDHWNNLTIEITSGVALGQSRTIRTYTNGVGFTVQPAFTVQIGNGITYRVISAVVYQPGITVVKNFPATIEPDTDCFMGISLVTNAGQPTVAEMTVGTITINRIRAGAIVPIVAAAAMSAAVGNIYYEYTFPAASWQPGDLYQGILTGQMVDVNGITYPISAVLLDGRVSREPEIFTTGVALADDAITSDKFDEVTAFPMTCVDLCGDPTAIWFTYTVTDIATGLPIEGVTIDVTTDIGGLNNVWCGTTDPFGVARDDDGRLPRLQPGTYYFWRELSGWTFTNPDTEVVS